jgi:hypothetical protein
MQIYSSEHMKFSATAVLFSVQKILSKVYHFLPWMKFDNYPRQ